MTTKTCKKCKIEKPLSDYFIERGRHDGLDRKCRECRNAERSIRSKAKPYQFRKSHIKRKYDLTMEDYDQMLEAQDGVCAVCKETETRKHKNGTSQSLSVDHHHETGAVRLLLCGSCNTTLGHAKENIERLRALADYIEAFNELMGL